jgi:hypothetical protein
MNNSYAHSSLSFLLPPFFHFSLLYLFFYLKDMILTYSWSRKALYTDLTAMMMTEPTPLFLKVLLLISLKRKTSKLKDHKEKHS